MPPCHNGQKRAFVAGQLLGEGLARAVLEHRVVTLQNASGVSSALARQLAVIVAGRLRGQGTVIAEVLVNLLAVGVLGRAPQLAARVPSARQAGVRAVHVSLFANHLALGGELTREASGPHSGPIRHCEP